MNRRKFLLGTAGVAAASQVLAKTPGPDMLIGSRIVGPDGAIIGLVGEDFKVIPLQAGHRTWVWDDKTSEYLQAGYKFVHDDDGMRVKRISPRFPTIMSYLMQKHG